MTNGRPPWPAGARPYQPRTGLIRLEAFLSNEPDSRQEIVIGELRGKSDEDLRQMLREEMPLLKEIGVEEEEPREIKP